MQTLEPFPEIACLSTLPISEAFPKKAKLLRDGICYVLGQISVIGQTQYPTALCHLDLKDQQEMVPSNSKVAPVTGSPLESVKVIVTVADPTWGGSGSTLRVWVQGRLFVRIGSEAI